MSEAEEKREWVKVAARYEERLTVALAENERLRTDMAQIEKIANIPPSDDSYGSLAVRMSKVWLLARGNQQSARPVGTPCRLTPCMYPNCGCAQQEIPSGNKGPEETK